ncbi:MAG: hypothetical protein AABW88_04060 [Nanoarchaeota archaeon]
MNKLNVSFVLLLLILPFVSGFGVTPAQRIFDYEPGAEQKHSFEIINSENKKVQLVILPQGDLNESIALSNYSVSFTPDISSIKIDYSVKVPSGLVPGRHSADILVIEIPDTSVSGTTYIGSVIGIVTKVVVDVPYPGKYVESALSVSKSEDGQTAFVIPVVSKGNLDIVRAKAVIDIFTPLNEKVASLTTQEIPVLSGERGELAVKWDTSAVVPGRYRAIAVVSYDESILAIEKEFSVGTEGLELKSVEVNDFSLGDIAKFEFLVENKLNFAVDGAYILMQVFNDAGDVMAEFKSATYDVQPFGSKLLVAFWDTEGVRKGTYDAKALINFGQSSIQKQLTLDVSDNDITVIGVGYVIKSANGGGNSLVTILVIVVVVLVLLNLTWFLILRRKIKNRK